MLIKDEVWKLKDKYKLRYFILCRKELAKFFNLIICQKIYVFARRALI
jgi:hypothetical protein